MPMLGCDQLRKSSDNMGGLGEHMIDMSHDLVP